MSYQTVQDQVTKSTEATCRRIDLADRSITLYKDWKAGKLTRAQYQVLQETTLSEIRAIARKEKEENGSKEEKEEG